MKPDDRRFSSVEVLSLSKILLGCEIKLAGDEADDMLEIDLQLFLYYFKGSLYGTR